MVAVKMDPEQDEVNWEGERRTQEVGYAVLPRFAEYAPDSKQRKLSWRERQREFAAMRRTAKVAQVENAIRRPIEQATWSVDPNGAPKDIVDLISNDLRLPIKGEDGQAPRFTGKVSFQDHIESSLESVFTGVAFFEQVYEEIDGLYRLRKLAFRPNLTIKEIKVKDDGGLEGIVQYSTNGRPEVFIPVERLLVYRNGPADGSWHGKSILTAARDDWLEMVKLKELHSVVLQRNSLGIAKYEASEKTPLDQRVAEIKAGLAMAQSYAAGKNSGFALPAGAKMPVEGVQGTLPNLLEAIEWYGNQIAIAAHATHLNLTGSGGSYALANVLLGEHMQGVNSTSEKISATASHHLVEDMVRLSFPNYEGTLPLIVSTRIQIQKDLSPGDISQLAAQKVLTLEPNLENWVRSIYRIPKVRPLSEALKAKKDRVDLEEQMGIKLAASEPEEAQSADQSLRDVINAIETNARYRKVKEDTEDILDYFDDPGGGANE